MDKALFRAYVKEIVKEQIDDSVENAVRKILPEVLSEAVAEVKKSSSAVNETSAVRSKPTVDRNKLAQMLGLDRIGDTFHATTDNLNVSRGMELPEGVSSDNPAVAAITKDYSAMMKAMGLGK
jgi:hypothetical protein